MSQETTNKPEAPKPVSDEALFKKITNLVKDIQTIRSLYVEPGASGFTLFQSTGDRRSLYTPVEDKTVRTAMVDSFQAGLTIIKNNVLMVALQELNRLTLEALATEAPVENTETVSTK